MRRRSAGAPILPRMRTFLLLSAGVLTGLLTAALPAAATSDPSPTCLISIGMPGPSTTCAQVHESGLTRAGTGRYTPGSPGRNRTLTATLQTSSDGQHWVVRRTASQTGTGNLQVTTLPFAPPHAVQVKACVTVTTSSTSSGSPLCSNPDSE